MTNQLVLQPKLRTKQTGGEQLVVKEHSASVAQQQMSKQL